MELKSLSLFGPKIRPIIAISFTTLISVLLICQRGKGYIGPFRNGIMEYPGTASFFKQLIASLLGVLWVYIAGSIFNLTTRLRLASDRKPRLQTLNLWAALGVQRIDFSLPTYYLAITAFMILIGHSISALWGGAIAPLPATANVANNMSIAVPVFNEIPPWMAHEFPVQDNPSSFRDTDDICQTNNGLSGYVPTCPVPGLQNLIISSANLASTLNGTLRRHSKNDNPNWSYVGRSYGVGSTQGLMDLIDITSYGEVMGYSYKELGYIVQSDCNVNQTAEFIIGGTPITVQPPGSNLTLDIYSAYGSTPGASFNWSFPIILTNESSSQGILTWAGTSNDSHGIVSLAGCGIYNAYNQLQCDVTWTPYLFNVGINFTNQTIFVDPLRPLQDASSFDVHSYLFTNTMASLGLLAQTSASSSYATLGESLLHNWATYNESIVLQTQGTKFNGNITYGANSTGDGDPSPARALQDSLDAMLDDILVGFGAASLSWEFDGNGTGSADMVVQYSAVRLGEAAYIYATLAINIVLFIITVEEAIRTRNWKGISLFDYLDLKSVIVAASAGGTGIADECRSKHAEGKLWDGDVASREVADTRVKLVLGKGHGKEDEEEGAEVGPAIVFAGPEEVDDYGRHADAETVPLKG